MADQNPVQVDTGNAQDHIDDGVILLNLDTMPDKKDTHSSIEIPLPSIAAHSRPHLYKSDHMYSGDQSFSSNGPTSSQTTELSTENSLVIDPETKSIPSLNPRHTKLQASMNLLETQIAEAGEKLSKTLNALRDTSTIHQKYQNTPSDEVMLEQAQIIVTEHIKLLHQYNEIKDVGLGLMGLIAEKEGKRLGEVMEERGVDNKD